MKSFDSKYLSQSFTYKLYPPRVLSHFIVATWNNILASDFQLSSAPEVCKSNVIPKLAKLPFEQAKHVVTLTRTITTLSFRSKIFFLEPSSRRVSVTHFTLSSPPLSFYPISIPTTFCIYLFPVSP